MRYVTIHLQWDMMLPPDTVGFILYVIATLVAYMLFHFYKNPLNNNNSGSNNSLSQRKPSPTSKKVLKVEQQYAPVTGNRSADKILASGRQEMIFRQQSDTNLCISSTSKWFATEESFSSFGDSYTTFNELSTALKNVGIAADQKIRARMVIGVDFTASNEWQGRRTFNKNCLHKLHSVRANPYQKVIQILGKTLEPFTEYGHVYAYGFGDAVSQDFDVFNLLSGINENDVLDINRPCSDFRQVLNQYNITVRRVNLSGPTSFAPIILRAIELVKNSYNQFHILLILADGQMEEAEATLSALVEASKYPLSIVMVGVGDGPWGLMEDCDDLLPARKFDNFQFVNFHELLQTKHDPEGSFALAALMEVPSQLTAMLELGYFDNEHKDGFVDVENRARTISETIKEDKEEQKFFTKKKQDIQKILKERNSSSNLRL